MKKIYLLLLVPVIILLHNSAAVCGSINENGSKGSEFIRNILKYEDIKDSLQLQSYLTRYDQLLQDALKKIDREDDVYDQNKDLFKLIHERYLNKYNLSVSFRDIFDRRYYNCVSASALYYALCLDLGINVKIYATPMHVFLKVFQENKPIRIELTDPVDGFNFKEKDKEKLIKSLLTYKLTTQEEIETKGIDSIYNEFNGEVKEISSLNLIQFLRSNAALNLFENEKYDEAFMEIRSALRMDTKNTSVQNNYLYIWANNFQQYSQLDNYEKMDSLINDALLYTDIPSDSKKDILSTAVSFIGSCIYDSRPVSDIDSLYRKCSSVMQNEPFYQEIMSPVKKTLDIYRVQDRLKKGYFDDAFLSISEMYKSSNKKDSKINDFYIMVTQNYVQYLVNSREYEKAIARADSLLQEFPDYPSTQDLYTNAVVYSTMTGGLYYKDPEGTKKLLLRAAQIAPKNPATARAMTTLYHEYAMDRVRKNDYENALKMVEEGLKFDSGDTLLLSDRELIGPKVKGSKKKNAK